MNIGRETEYVEFKKSTSEIRAGMVSIASILNKHGEGSLFFGVKDNGDVTGQEIGKDTIRDVSRAIAGNIRPECWYEIEKKTSSDGKTFIEVNFSGQRMPYSAYGKYYQRFADEDRPIPDSGLEALFRSRIRDYSAWENEDSGVPISDVDERLFERVIARGIDSGRIRYKTNDLMSIMSKLGLIAASGKTGKEAVLNNAGNVLFSGEAPVLLKLATYATDRKTTFTKLDHFEGNIFECIEAGIDYIIKEIDWNISFDGNPGRNEEPEIPREAIREIVVNAFAHGSYGGNTTFEIDVYKDRVTIYSPGFFPLGYVPEDFALRSEEPVMMNPKIINVLFKVGEIESFGSGFERTFAACEKAGVDYSYANTKAGFRFEFKRPKKAVKYDYLTGTESRVYEELKTNSYATAKDVAASMGMSEKTIYRAIKKLKDSGMIVRDGSDYNGSWIIK